MPSLLPLMLLALPICILAPLILDGVERKIRARIQGRVGPPPHQTLLDVAKLFRKEVASSGRLDLAIACASLGLALALGAAISILVGYATKPFSTTLIALGIAFLASCRGTAYLCSIVTGNGFAFVGTTRGAILGICLELLAVLSLSLPLALERNPSPPLIATCFATVFVTSFVASARLPYDLHEAEPELASGALIEFSGPLLATFIAMHLIERFTLTLAPGLVLATTISGPLNRILVALAMGTTTWILHATISTCLGRSRMDLAMRSLVPLSLATTILWVVLWGALQGF